MIFKCEACDAVYQISNQRIRPNGTKFRCVKCKNVFKVVPDVAGTDAFSTPRSDNIGNGKFPADSFSMSGELPGSPALSGDATLPIGAMDQAKRFTMTEPSVQDLPVKTEPVGVDAILREKPQRPRKKRGIEQKYTPFRRKLIYFAFALIGFIALIVIPFEVYRPIMTLLQLIDNGKNLTGGVEASVSSSDISKVNRFVLNHMISPGDDKRPEMTLYHGLAYNMLLIEDQLLSKDAILAKLEFLGDLGGNFDYDRLIDAGKYWKSLFSAEPEVLEILKKQKRTLLKAMDNSRAAGYKPAYFMIMLDSGKREGFFKNQIAFVVEGTKWWQYPTYLGEPYTVKETSAWRNLALEGKSGYGHSAVHDPIFPRFIEDQYGAWFSVWLTKKNDDMFNVFSIDFDASQVKKQLQLVGITVASVILILTVIVILVTRTLSRLVTRPITELTKGAGEVARGNYAYEVPIIKEDEFGDLTKQFNLMVRGQRERLNLMQTLEKFLSKELAEKAAQSGLVLGGRKTTCTVMFTDFAGFSTITQKMTAVESVNVLNSYYDGMIPIIKKYGGFPDKYIGDAIVAIFGAPVQLEDHAERAVACAIEMQWKMRELNERRRNEGRTVFEMRIGLNSGPVIVGAIGCDMKLEYTSIGETTNLANRMESICAIGHVMMAEGTYHLIKNTFFRGVNIAATPERVNVKGYPEPVATYRIWVDNLEIKKDLDADGPIKSFYIYHSADHKLKHSPNEVGNAQFKNVAQYL